MNILNAFKVIRFVQTFFAEPVPTISANISLNVTIFGIASTILPVFFAFAFRAQNGRECFQFLFALLFINYADFYNGAYWYAYAAG